MAAFSCILRKGKNMSELRFEYKNMQAADLGEESCVPDLLGERILQNSLTFYLDETDEIYERYGRLADAYPYRQRNNYSRILKEKQIRTAVLENDRIKAVFLPDYGGRLWELWDKKENMNLLYTNDVLQFSNLAVRNAWFSGGVEWNLGIIGHHPFTTESLYVARTQTEQGEPVLRMYEYERIRGVTWQMDFWLEEGCPYLKCRMRIVNDSAEVIPMYWWSNMAVPEYDQGHITVPAAEAYSSGGAYCYKVPVPMVDGTDISDYQKIPRSVDYFFHIPEEEPKYIVNVNRNGKGLLQFSTKRLQGRKLFSWGNNTASDHWQEFLTKDAGRYVEIQAGLGKTQYGCIPMAPHTAWEWMERYGAVNLGAGACEQSHEWRYEKVTEELKANQEIEKLKKRLEETKGLAKKQAKLVQAGSGYGTFAPKTKRTGHLEFVNQSETLKKWKHFFETGILHMPNPEDEPDEFWNGEKFLAYLEEKTARKDAPNAANWYAHYQLGISYLIAGRNEDARDEFARSVDLTSNAWAYHGLACLYLKSDPEKAKQFIMEGMALQRERLSYQKEGFKILEKCGAYKEIDEEYKKQTAENQKNGRIQYYYVAALAKLERNEEAYHLLNDGDGIDVSDIREGDSDIQSIWESLHEKVYGEKGHLPHYYNFKVN